MTPLTLGLGTFGDVTVDANGDPVPMHQVLRDIVEQGVLADQVGVDHFVLGEHHRDDYAISAPEVVLAAIATRTERITLASGVTVLSSDDPVRVYERFATLDGISGGRAEIQVGRGSFTESFDLFGNDLADYVVLFDDKLDLLARLRSERPVTWTGRTRAAADRCRGPPPHAARHPAGVGRRRRHHRVGGPHRALRPADDARGHRRAARPGSPRSSSCSTTRWPRRGTAPDGGRLPVGVHSPGFVADTDEEARELLFPHFKANRDRIGRERGWGEVTRDQFDAEVDSGSLYVGSPETVAQKIAATVRALGIDRFDLKYANGPQPHADLMHAIELYGTVVVPRVRELLADPQPLM